MPRDFGQRVDDDLSEMRRYCAADDMSKNPRSLSDPGQGLLVEAGKRSPHKWADDRWCCHKIKGMPSVPCILELVPHMGRVLLLNETAEALQSGIVVGVLPDCLVDVAQQQSHVVGDPAGLEFSLDLWDGLRLESGINEIKESRISWRLNLVNGIDRPG